MKVDIELVKQLRRSTLASIVDCKKALEETGCDLDKSVDVLRKKGSIKAARKASRETAEGIIHSYIHLGSKIGVLLELNCETDFVAKTDEFKNLAQDIALQIAAASPLYIKQEEVPQELIDRERSIYEAQINNKPKQIIDKIVDGKLNKYYSEICLLLQPFVKDPQITVKDIIVQCIAKTGENITMKRFIRYQIGE